MEIKSTVIDALPEEVKITYPYLCSYNTGSTIEIVLLTAPNTGVLLSNTSYPELVGKYFTDVAENKYTPYHGAVTLTM